MAAVRGSDVLEASQVRIRSAAGGVVGAGFLVSGDVLCTCAHVVARALGVPDAPGQVPGKPVDLDFPLLPGCPRARASVVSWRHGGTDVALLRLDTAVAGARPVRLVDGTGVWGHAFRVLGFPAGADHGIWASGTLRAGQGAGWVQMEPHEPGPRIAEGFSGAPVWDDAQDGVVGMTVAAHRGQRTAYLLPSAELVDEETLRPRCPFRGLAAFTEDDAEFFHGRDGDTDRLHAAVRRRPVTLVAGPSGCGKSSLVRAGVLPRLRAEGMSVSELRPVPGTRPATVLARMLTGLLEPDLDEVGRLAGAERLARILETADGVPAELRGRILAREAGAGHVLFVDQLEEYAAADPGAARDLFARLAALASTDGAAVLRVVATARPDSLDALVTDGTSDVVSDAVQFLAPLAAGALRRAVTGPVDAVPGLWFEPGLPERIVADAGDEPGRMPLVQFTLTELWKRRSRSMLTHAAYDDLGGVAGALVGYADDALLALTRTRRELAPRLFVQLARPGDGDTFARRPTRAADLAPELLDLARELAPGKLVVLSRPPGGAERDEIVDLAHEALTALWPRLREWLVDSRDFRAWQEQLRADLHRWRAQDRERARLLSGTDLAEADRRLAEHPEDISADERAYILLSRRHARRGTRRRQTAVGALALLTVLAVVLALTTWQNLRHTEEQLRLQAAGLLAQAADDHPAGDPSTALQLALAAWQTRQTPHTRQALMNQYARGQYLVAAHPSVWRGRVTALDATPDGRTLVVHSKPGGGNRSTLTVVTGALEGIPRARQLRGVPEGKLLTALSPDGRYFAVTAGEGVRLWRLSDPEHPTDLEPGDHERPEEAGGSLDFSSDAKRLLLTMDDHSRRCYENARSCVPTFAEAWRLPSGAPIDVPERLVPETSLKEAAFTSDANTVVSIFSEGSRHRVELRDFTTGRLLHATTATADALSGPRLRAGGEVLVRTDTAPPSARALGRTPGRTIELPRPAGYEPDATSRYDVDGTSNTVEIGPSSGGYAEPVLTDLRTGHTYRTRVPVSNGALSPSDLAAVRAEAGGLTVFAPVGSALLVVRAERQGGERFQEDNGMSKYAVSPDGRFIARTGEKRLEILDTSRTRHRSVPLPSHADPADWTPAWTADSERVVVWGEGGNLLRSYAAQDLSDSVPLDEVVPGAKELDDVMELRGGEVDAVAALHGSEVAVLTVDGRLTRFDAADGAVLTPLFPVHPAPNWAGTGLTDEILVHGQLLARPGHPGQVAAVTRTGTVRGEILLWDVTGPRHLDTLSGPAITVAFGPEHVTGSLAFDADGSHLAVHNNDDRVHVWDVDRGKRVAHSALRSGNDTLIGFGPDGSVVTHLHGKRQIRIDELTGEGSSYTLPVVADDWTAGDVRGHRLTVDTGSVRQTFDLRPDVQFRTLCAAAGRDYTDAERELLPEGTPSEPPCS
jgi:WD40 repeat protein